MRSFLKFTLASFTGSLLFFLVLAAALSLGAVGLVGVLVAGLARGDSEPTVRDDSILVYDLATAIPDTEVIPSPTDALLSGSVPQQLTLREATNALREAASDERIVGLYLTSSGPVGTGLAAQEALRDAILVFQEADKPVLAYDVAWSEREYYLASLADTLYINPFGSLEMNGLLAEVMYQAEALDKLGIEVQVTRVGKYKSAVEPFIRNTMSPEEREQTRRLLDDLWQTLITDTAAAREIAPATLQAVADTQGLLLGVDAVTQQLADEVAYEDEVITALRQLTGEQDPDAEEDDASDSFRHIGLERYAHSVTDPRLERSTSQEIALVYAEGPIVYGGGDDGLGTSSVIAGDQLARTLRQLRADDDVQAVVLRVNSPGGSATASEVILREVQLLQEAGKPVVVSMGNVAASGGYWIAALADAIVAEPTTITGSIGVFSLFLSLEELGNKVGVTWEEVKTAELADLFSTTRPRTPEELAILQRSVDVIYDAFLDRVAEGRDLPRQRVEELAQGRIWSGTTALELGLVDELGGIDQAITTAATLAELEEDDWQLREYPEATDWQRLFGDFLNTGPAPDPLMVQLQRIAEEMALVRTLNDPRGLYLLMPYTLDLR